MRHIIEPDSSIKLYSGVEVSGNGLNLIFSDSDARTNYFERRKIATLSNNSYVFKNTSLKVNLPLRDLMNANFLSYKNTGMSELTFYCEIIDKEYVSNDVTEIVFAVDWWLTLMFRTTFKNCLIEREHLSQADWEKAQANPWDKSIRELNTVEGHSFTDADYDFVDYTTTEFDTFPTPKEHKAYPTYFVLGLPEDEIKAGKWPALVEMIADFDELPDGVSKPQHGWNLTKISPRITAGVIQTVTYFISNEAYRMQRFLSLLGSAGMLHSVTTFFMTTADMLDNMLDSQRKSFTLTPTRLTEGLNPKLKRAPYSYLDVISPDGSVKKYKYELFKNPKNGIKFECNFTIEGMPCLSLFPLDYIYGGLNRGEANFNERLDLLNVPQIGYSTDSFMNWLGAQSRQMGMAGAGMAGTDASKNKGISYAAGLIGGGVGVAAGAKLGGKLLGGTMGKIGGGVAGAALGMAAGAALDYFNDNGNIVSENRKAESAQQIINGDSPEKYDYAAEETNMPGKDYHAGTSGAAAYQSAALGQFTFQFHFKTLTDAQASLIGMYFNAYGYKSGRIGIPRVLNEIGNKTNKPHYVSYNGDNCTYVKTNGCKCITPFAPATEQIAALFDRGCRFIKGDGR